MALGPSLPIVIAFGVQGTNPFTLGRLVYVSQVQPQLVTVSQVGMVVNPGLASEAMVLGTVTDPAPAATEKVRISGGVISQGVGVDSVVLGRLASALGSGVAIGTSATSGSVGVTDAIGNLAAATQNGANGSALAIGGGATATPFAAGSEQYLIAIGHFASAKWGAAIAIGQTSEAGTGGRTPTIAIGVSARAVHDDTVAIGHSAVAARPRVLVVGNAAIGPDTGGQDVIILGMDTVLGGAGGTNTGCVVIGNSMTLASAVTNLLVIGHGLTDTVVSNTGYIGSQGTVLSKLFLGRGASHTAAHNLRVAVTEGSGANVAAGVLTIQGGRGTGSGVSGQIAFEVGLTGGGGSGQQTLVQPLLVTALGATVTGLLSVVGAGGASVPAIAMTNITNGAGASAGTLTNAPSVGNPNIWVPISINGTVRLFPGW